MSGFSIDSVMDSVENEITSGSEESVDTEDRVQSIMDLDEEEDDSEDLPDPTDEELNKNKEKTKTKSKDSDKDEEEESEEEDSDEEEEDESEEEDEEEEKEEQKNGRLLKYKVDGKEVEKFYTDEELASAISAKEASLKRFNEIDKKSKEFEKKELEFNQKYDFVKKELSETRSGFDTTLS